MLDPTALMVTAGVSKTGAVASSGALQPDRSLLATASAPSVESYVMTYCDDTSLTAAPLPNTDEMLDSSQVVLMGCGSVN